MSGDVPDGVQMFVIWNKTFNVPVDFGFSEMEMSIELESRKRYGDPSIELAIIPSLIVPIGRVGLRTTPAVEEDGDG